METQDPAFHAASKVYAASRHLGCADSLACRGQAYSCLEGQVVVFVVLVSVVVFVFVLWGL